MYAQGFHLIEQQFIARRSSGRNFIEPGCASQAGTLAFVSTDRHGAQVAPAVRMERGRHSTAAIERADKSAPSRTDRVPFGLHPLRTGPLAGAAA